MVQTVFDSETDYIENPSTDLNLSLEEIKNALFAMKIDLGDVKQDVQDLKDSEVLTESTRLEYTIIPPSRPVNEDGSPVEAVKLEEHEYVLNSEAGFILQVPQISSSVTSFDLSHEGGFLAFEKELRRKLQPLVNLSLRGDDGRIILIEQPLETEISLGKYCRVKYGNNDFKSVKGCLPPFPEILTTDPRGVSEWLEELYQFKYAYLLSDRIMWLEMDKIIGKSLGLDYVEELIDFVGFLKNKPFDRHKHISLDWDGLFRLLDTGTTGETKESFTSAMKDEFEWAKEYPRYNSKDTPRVAKRYSITIQKLIVEALVKWCDIVPSNLLWEHLFPKIKLMLLTILDKADEIGTCDPLVNDQVFLFGVDIDEDLKGVLKQILGKIYRTQPFILQKRLNDFIKQDNNLLDELHPKMKWAVASIPNDTTIKK